MKEYRSEFGTYGPRPEVPKKIYDRNKIIAGVIVFIALVTVPLWDNLGKAIPPPDPKLDTPMIQKLAEPERHCVQTREYMRSYHMQLLDNWRNEVVRSANREYVGLGGKKYNASLSNTCMECHSNKSQFCDQCHNFVAVTPYCWGCHSEKEKKLAEAK